MNKVSFFKKKVRVPLIAVIITTILVTLLSLFASYSIANYNYRQRAIHEDQLYVFDNEEDAKEFTEDVLNGKTISGTSVYNDSDE